MSAARVALVLLAATSLLPDVASGAEVPLQTTLRHVLGTPSTKDESYDGIRAYAGRYGVVMAANNKYLAVVVAAKGGKSFVVIPLEMTGKLDVKFLEVVGHSDQILSLKWNPHDDNMIASTGEDNAIRIWNIPEGGLTRNFDFGDAILNLDYHERRVPILEWHPSASNVLLSASEDPTICIWNIDESTIEAEWKPPESQDIPYSAAWNYDGNRIVVTYKDRMLRVYDPRARDLLTDDRYLIVETRGHEGGEPQYATYLRNGNIFTTGFSQTSERQYAVWDGNSLELLTMKVIDTAAGTLIPFYDADLNMIYLTGKGDSLIRYYEMVSEEPYANLINIYKAPTPHSGITMLNKRGVDVKICEIARFYRTVGDKCEVISMTVPRESGSSKCSAAIYPDTAARDPAQEAGDWFSGSDKTPLLIPVENWNPTKGVSQGQATDPAAGSTKISGEQSQLTPASSQESQHTPASSQEKSADTTPGSIGDLERRMKDLEDFVKQSLSMEPTAVAARTDKISNKGGAGDHERRIKTLEDFIVIAKSSLGAHEMRIAAVENLIEEDEEEEEE